MDQITKKKIWSIINCIETGTPYFDYASYTILPDGPNGILQYTLSVGFTEYGGALKQVIESYINKKGKYVDRFHPYVARIGKFPSLASDKNFISQLQFVSNNDPLMREAQDEVYERNYFQKALKWAEYEGFTLPLSILVIFDSFLQSGTIFTFLRNRFPAKTPRNGGNEKEWIKQYVDVRNTWLSNHSNKAVRNSSYRTRTYKQLINKNNWELVGPIKTLNGCNIL